MRPNYAEYIQSGDWVNRCVRFFGDRPMCAVRDCRKRWREGHVQVHHRTYDRLGRELKTDLVPLCDSCHKRAHDYALRQLERRPVLSRDEALRRGTALLLSGGGSRDIIDEFDAADAAEFGQQYVDGWSYV